MLKPIPLFVISAIFTALTILFLFSPVSLNGFKADVYFTVVTIVVNILSIVIGFRRKSKSFFKVINIAVAIFLLNGLIIFAGITELHIKRVYTPLINKENLYAAPRLKYRKAYFANWKRDCGDGTYWETYVPTFFPLIEVETKRNACFVINPPGGSNLYTFAAE